MAKMINVDELIEFCNTERSMLHAHNNSVACAALRRVVEFAKEYAVEAVPDNGWISVKDEMPKLGQRVMAFCRAGIMTFLRYDGEVWFEMSSRNEYLLSFVTHWQPLPKPPKGE